MKCKNCNACKKGFFKSKPNEYVCIGVKEPFVIPNINMECTEYINKNDTYLSEKHIKLYPYIDDNGIYIPEKEFALVDSFPTYRCLITKDLFVEAYNKWIKGENDD